MQSHRIRAIAPPDPSYPHTPSQSPSVVDFAALPEEKKLNLFFFLIITMSTFTVFAAKAPMKAPMKKPIAAKKPAFGAKKPSAPVRRAPKGDDELALPGTERPSWLDGSLPGDRGFDPFGLAKPTEYLQMDLDRLDQNAATNPSGRVIGKLKKVDNKPQARTIVVRRQ